MKVQGEKVPDGLELELREHLLVSHQKGLVLLARNQLAPPTSCHCKLKRVQLVHVSPCLTGDTRNSGLIAL